MDKEHTSAMDTPLLRAPDHRRGFRIGIICALKIEATMVEKVFDRNYEHRKYNKAHGDPNSYSMGVIAGHNVVLAHCGKAGSNRAAQVAAHLRSSFSGIEITLVVGICGAVPFIERDGKIEEVVLGDLMVSTEVVQFDLQRQGPAGMQRKSGSEGLGPAGLEVLSLLAMLQTLGVQDRLTRRLGTHLRVLQEQNPERTTYPGHQQDQLFHANFIHTHQLPLKGCEDCNMQLGICEKSCDELGCNTKGSNLILRTRLNEDTSPKIHFGCFGSSNTVLKSGEQRDRLARIEGIIAFEMEGSGVWPIYPTIVIKAACDYADSHKHKTWQPYAAAVAAAGLKGLLEELQFQEEEDTLTRPSSKINFEPLNVLPFRRDPKFVGRQDILGSMLQKFQHRMPSYQLRIALVGMGGVGKSQIAIEFVYQLLEKQRDCSVFWVYAATKERFEQSFREIASKVGIEYSEGVGPLEAVHQWFSQLNRNWIMILDNLDEEETVTRVSANGKALRDYIPSVDKGTIVITTRSRTVAVTLAGLDNTLCVGPMKEADSMQLLSGRTAIDSQEAAEELLYRLGWLPLAITHAGAYISINSPHWTVSKYLKALNIEEKRVEALGKTEIFDDRRDSSAKRTVMATWHISFKGIKQEHPAAADLLSLMSMFDHQNIPEELLHIPNDADVEFDKNINVLLDYSLITVGSHENSFSMHLLVQMAVFLWLKEGSELTRQFILAMQAYFWKCNS